MSVQEEHKNKITEYLTEVGTHLRDVDAEGRQAMLSQLSARIQADVRNGGGSTEVTAVEAVLRTYGPPANQAAKLRGQPVKKESDSTLLVWDDRVWLGVCGGIAKQIGVDANFVRLVFVALGFVPPVLPFLMTAYLGFYAVVYVSSPKGALPKLRWFPVVRRVFIAALGIAALYGGAHLMLVFFSKLSLQFLSTGLAVGSRWNWLLTQNASMFFWVMLYTMPVAVMSAMPIKSTWAGTLDKVVKAAIALYALVLCIGLAFMIAGLVVNGADQFADSPGTDAIRELFQ